MRLPLFVCASLGLLACGGVDSPAADAGPLGADAQQHDRTDSGLCSLCDGCEESRSFESAQHVAGGIDYTDLPPFGGAHDPCWARFGVHAVEVPDERWVHTLEHGAVVFLYHCPDGCPDEVAALEILAAPRPFAVVMPYAALPTAFGVVAWGHRLLSECFDEEAFGAFYDRHFNSAPESLTSPPPGGC